MIHPIPPSIPTDPAARASRGGFAWWYADVVDANGDGIVLIWSYGLPFLPGYASAARAGRAPEARSRPSLNIAVYQGGRSTFYLLQEYTPKEVADDGRGNFRFRDSDLRTRPEGAGWAMDVTVDCVIPGSTERLRGTVAIRGPAVALPPTPGDPSHAWGPLATATAGEVRLNIGDRTLLSIDGRAYHDRNHGTKPLHELGIAHWIWGRSPLPDGELIHYVLWPEDGSPPRALLFHVALDGSAHSLPDPEVQLARPRRALFGMEWWEALSLRSAGTEIAQVRHGAVVDDGPFYLRFLTEVRTPDGEIARGIGEAVRPDRIDLDTHRRFVRMAVDAPDGQNSALLPLFSGPRDGRFGRLLRHCLAGAR